MDLIVRKATLRGKKGAWDIAVDKGKIVKIAKGIKTKGKKEIKADGKLVTPTFVDPHVHLDKALISEVVRPNISGTLTEAIEIIWKKKHRYTTKDIITRAGRVIEWAVMNGTTALRTHVDVDTIVKLKAVKGLLEVREMYKDLVDLQIVAFPQEGIIQDPGTEKLMEQAMELGCDVVGGMPYNERTPDEWRKHIDVAFRIAKDFDADIDMHVDETDDPGARSLAILAQRTIEEGYFGRVTAGHTCALSAYPDPYAAKVIGMVKEAKMNMITNPATNLMLQGRYDKQPYRRGITRVKELMAAGINVCYGQDCLKDTFYPTFGQADLLEVGLITAHAAHLSQPSEVEKLYDMPTERAAQTIRLADYGLKKGSWASFNILDCQTVQEAFRIRPDRIVIRKGKVLAETKTTKKLMKR